MDLRGTAFLLLIAGPVASAPYKCLQPDGSVVYQQTLCAAESAGTELALDSRQPGGAGTKDYSVEGQLKALEAARKKTAKKPPAEKQRKEPVARARPAVITDRARCAKHRAEIARWRRAVRKPYRDRDEQEYKEQMLAHHEAKAERYCTKE